MSALLRQAAPVLASQHGLITIEQFRALGGSPAAAKRFIERGIWIQVDRGLYGAAGAPESWERAICAAVLTGPPGTRASHRAAAKLHGLWSFDDDVPVEVTVHRGQRYRRAGVRVHESVDLDEARTVVVNGVPATDLARLAMDLGDVVSERHYRFVLQDLQRRGSVETGVLLRTYLQYKERGRNGGGRLRDWLDRYGKIGGLSESALELLVLDSILDAGFDPPERQVSIVTPAGTFRVDMAYPDLKVAIEVDGLQHEFERASDLRRDAALKALGWRVIRVRSGYLATDTCALLRELRRLSLRAGA